MYKLKLNNKLHFLNLYTKRLSNDKIDLKL